MAGPRSFAETLYRIPPAVYRTRDESGDLRRYLEGCAELMDALHATLRQKLADNFPDNPPGDSPLDPCQDWLLPYFARLLHARLVSPLADGRRDEIALAIRWRQGKGTLEVLDGVVEGIGQTEAVVHEGWRRVAVTPRVNRPLSTARAMGYAQEPEPANPGSAARHPDLEAATVDFRCPSRALATTASNPAAESIEIDGETRFWRQGSLHGTPCFPGSYEDRSPRTVDLRTPDWRVGHHHPARVVAYIPPPAGFFPPGAPAVAWADPPGPAFLDLIEVETEDPERTVYRARTLGEDDHLPPRITGPVTLPAMGPEHVWRFEGVVIEGTLTVPVGRLELDRCAAAEVRNEGGDPKTDQIRAEDCLLGAVRTSGGLTRLSYCTVLGSLETSVLYASDCILLAVAVQGGGSTDPPLDGCIRLSRIAPEQEAGGMRLHGVTRAGVVLMQETFGAHGAGVLHAANREAILAGAEDGGEFGAYHHQHHHAIRRAIHVKMQSFLPVGLELVLVWDPRLLAGPYAFD